MSKTFEELYGYHIDTLYVNLITAETYFSRYRIPVLSFDVEEWVILNKEEILSGFELTTFKGSLSADLSDIDGNIFNFDVNESDLKLWYDLNKEEIIKFLKECDND